MKNFKRTLILTAVLASLVPSAASAATRYVSPYSSVKGPCFSSQPCNYRYVLEGAGSQLGDTVVLMGGTYDVGSGLNLARRLEIVGDPNAPTRPLITTAVAKAETVTSGFQAWGSSFKGIDIEAGSYDQSTAIDAGGDITTSDVHITCHYRCVSAMSNGATATLEGTTITMGSGSVAVRVGNGGTLRHTLITIDGSALAASLGKGSRVEDSTVISDGYGVRTEGGTVERSVIKANSGLEVHGEALVRDSLLVATHAAGTALTAYAKTTVRNVTAIATGPSGRGLYASTDPFVDDPSSIDARNVIARGPGQDVSGSAAADVGFGCPCAAAPVDIAYSNFADVGQEIQTAGGHNQTADPKFLNEAKGDYRLASGSPAIDAGMVDAFVGGTTLFGIARKQGAAPDLGVFESTPPPKPVDKTAPVLAKVKVLRKKPARVSFKLSEKASVKVAIFRKANGKKAATSRTVKLVGKAGLNTRQIAKRALRPGSYVFILVATDAAKNKSAPVTRKLIVK